MASRSETLLLDSFLPYRLSYTSNLVSGAIAKVYQSQFDLTIPEWRIIAVVAEEETTQQAICARTRMDKVAVSRSAKTLAQRGLIARRANAADGRSHLLVLTNEGRALYDQIAPAALRLEKQIFGMFSADELGHLSALLKRIDEAAQTAALQPADHPAD